MVKEYTYESVGTTITDYQDGRIFLSYGRPGKDENEIKEQALWVEKILDKISNEQPKEKFRLLVDLEKLMNLRLDPITKKIYKKVISKKYLKKVAFAGDVVNYSKIMPLMVVTRLLPSKTKFFFSIPGAYKWLKWQ